MSEGVTVGLFTIGSVIASTFLGYLGERIRSRRRARLAQANRLIPIYQELLIQVWAMHDNALPTDWHRQPRNADDTSQVSAERALALARLEHGSDEICEQFHRMQVKFADLRRRRAAIKEVRDRDEPVPPGWHSEVNILQSTVQGLADHIQKAMQEHLATLRGERPSWIRRTVVKIRCFFRKLTTNREANEGT